MIPELTELGFTRNEANVYFASLKQGACSVQQLAHATGLNRITVHSIVEKFLSLQLFQQSMEGKRRRVTVASPERLSFLLEQPEEELTRKKHSLAAMLPSLQNLYRQKERGLQIETFHGVPGYVRMCENILTSKTETLEYADIDALNAVIGPYVFSDYLPIKYQRKIPTKFLYIDTPASRTYIRKAYLERPEASPAEAKFVSREEFPMDSFFVIYDQKLAIFTPSTMDGVIIHDRAIYASLRPFFFSVWARAGEAVTNR